MELEIVNKLYLELSQIATATTAKELALIRRTLPYLKKLGEAEFSGSGHAELTREESLELFAIIGEFERTAR